MVRVGARNRVRVSGRVRARLWGFGLGLGSDLGILPLLGYGLRFSLELF